MTDHSNSEPPQFDFQGEIRESDLFAREFPAILEGPSEIWLFTKSVIDHGSHILETLPLRSTRALRDSVSSALLRRALVTAESVRHLFAKGLQESGFSLVRILLEIRVTLQLVTGDSKDIMASRLAAFHYLAAQRYGTSVLKDDTSRVRLQSSPEWFGYTKSQTKAFKEYFSSPGFDEVREAVKTSQHWHGFPNVEDAFAAVGAQDDYRRMYALLSPFVHVTNLDFDFLDIRNGNLILKPLTQREPSRLLPQLATMVITLLEVLELYVHDRDYENYPANVRTTGADGSVEDVHPLSVLQYRATKMFNPWLVLGPTTS
ncbi:MAG TPA: DUF5677 domain-containing protein [Longimicrobiaceae bacterium]|jgi:hypothetical protein|nr:DUF5677 domain-containing protein [Longimicrobiaceae bacterium]